MPDVDPIVLIAGTSDAIETAKQALGPAFSYRVAHSLEDAISQLSPDLDVILCNVAFDSSRMFDFIRAARSLRSPKIVPIICFRHPRRALSEATHHGLELSLQEFERTSFVDLYALSKQGTVGGALSALRQAVLTEIQAQLGSATTPTRSPAD